MLGISPNFHIHVSVSDIYSHTHSRPACSAAGKYVDRSRVYINRSQTHACGNWDWGRAIPFLGIYKLDFRCCVPYSEWQWLSRAACRFSQQKTWTKKCILLAGWRFWLGCKPSAARLRNHWKRLHSSRPFYQKYSGEQSSTHFSFGPGQ